MLDFFHVYMYFLGQIDRDQICCNRYMMLYSSKPQHRESGLMCSGSMDDVDKTEHFLPETNNHPTLSIPHSGFCPLNGASIGPSLAALPFSAEAAFPYIVCNISYFLLSCKIRLLHIGWKKKKVVNFCTTFKMNLQIMKKWVSPIRTHPCHVLIKKIHSQSIVPQCFAAFLWKFFKNPSLTSEPPTSD